jgi:hypothetical protein
MPLRAKYRPIPTSPAPHPAVHNFADLTGRKLGRLTAEYFAGKVDDKSCWVCLCECGTRVVAEGKLLTSGKAKSCGCLAIDRTKAVNTRHGGRQLSALSRLERDARSLPKQKKQRLPRLRRTRDQRVRGLGIFRGIQERYGRDASRRLHH